MQDIDIAKRYVSKAGNAKSTNKDFTLTFPQFKKLMKQKTCYYTGIILDTENKDSLNYLTLDRIDASIGYTKANTVAAAHCVNQFKSMFENSTSHINIEMAKTILNKC